MTAAVVKGSLDLVFVGALLASDSAAPKLPLFGYARALTCCLGRQGRWTEKVSFQPRSKLNRAGTRGRVRTHKNFFYPLPISPVFQQFT